MAPVFLVAAALINHGDLYVSSKDSRKLDSSPGHSEAFSYGYQNGALGSWSSPPGEGSIDDYELSARSLVALEEKSGKFGETDADPTNVLAARKIGESSQQGAQKSDQRSSSGSREGSDGGQTAGTLQQLPPDIAKDVLVRAGKTLQKQQVDAHGQMQKSLWRMKYYQEELFRNSLTLPIYDRVTGRVESIAKGSESPEQARCNLLKHGNEMLKADEKVHEIGRDVEHVGMVNKYMHKRMKEEFSPKKNPLEGIERARFNSLRRVEQKQHEGYRIKTMRKDQAGIKSPLTGQKRFSGKSSKSTQSGQDARVAQAGKIGQDAKVGQNRRGKVADLLKTTFGCLFKFPSRRRDGGSG